jgi:hypothetical protein
LKRLCTLRPKWAREDGRAVVIASGQVEGVLRMNNQTSFMMEDLHGKDRKIYRGVCQDQPEVQAVRLGAQSCDFRELRIDKNGPTGARGASFGGSWTLLLIPSALREPLQQLVPRPAKRPKPRLGGRIGKTRGNRTTLFHSQQRLCQKQSFAHV